MSTESSHLSLERLVTTVAVRLMAANAATSVTVSQEVLGVLVKYFDVDFSFLRYNDHAIRASILIAEWPVRPDIPDPDPLGVVYFADADPVFAESEHGKKPLVFRPDDEDYQKRIEEGRNIPQTSMAAAPLVSGDLTTGVVGFVKIGDRKWARGRTQRLGSHRIAIRTGPGSGEGRGAASSSRRTRRPDRGVQPPGTPGPPGNPFGTGTSRSGNGPVLRHGSAEDHQ